MEMRCKFCGRMHMQLSEVPMNWLFRCRRCNEWNGDLDSLNNIGKIQSNPTHREPNALQTKKGDSPKGLVCSRDLRKSTQKNA